MQPPFWSSPSSFASGRIPAVGRPDASTTVTPFSMAASSAARVRGVTFFSSLVRVPSRSSASTRMFFCSISFLTFGRRTGPCVAVFRYLAYCTMNAPLSARLPRAFAQIFSVLGGVPFLAAFRIPRQTSRTPSFLSKGHKFLASIAVAKPGLFGYTVDLAAHQTLDSRRGGIVSTRKGDFLRSICFSSHASLRSVFWARSAMRSCRCPSRPASTA